MNKRRIFDKFLRGRLLTSVILVLVSLLTLFSLRKPDFKTPQQFSADHPGCSALLTADLQHHKEDLERLLSSPRRRHPLQEDFYVNLTRDCQVYVARRGFFTVPLSEEERAFPIAYSMVVHDQIEMFERLLRAVYAPQNLYCVHVDRKSAGEFQAAVEAIASCFQNVFMADKSEKVTYASWSRVQADLNCMETLSKSPVRWRYLLNTCGTDFPIKTNKEIVEVLKVLNGRNSMETEATNDYKKQRWLYHYNVSQDLVRTDVKKSPPPIRTPMFSGNAYFVVSRAFVEHVLQDQEVRALLQWEKDTYSPDEHLWATLQRMPSVPGAVPTNAKYDLSDMQALARVVKWSYLAGDVRKGAPYGPCSGVNRKAVCVYGLGDLQWLLSQHHLLANKFDPLVDDLVIRCLEAILYFKALDARKLTSKPQGCHSLIWFHKRGKVWLQMYPIVTVG
ncbi:beta-1,3-galactosyl-O-glycosyl-glycoprotein beta-1,6-N-acetylglucosaminyltransferase 3 isoform X2 [Nerophis ophidion]|uniref:beta-1,3-galactosyl-O-glycosyl-glycoprotein beta-1,6-N-acetylglucosaminyltransferase 3 isoform X2 n=1 Tax=Nerophis ophidion TaxID=159077 RepID=UPI002ADFD3F6|nr:beta-1,3-galactosyl-O-glycosyl-glycoprotein beta-1,6-N-acetylglucosaminyltransferase 3 isoform X2 [Nerophis ophidion]